MDKSRFEKFEYVKSSRPKVVRRKKTYDDEYGSPGYISGLLYDMNRYKHGFYVIIKGKEYEVVINPNDLRKYNHLFSTPENTEYLVWSIHKQNAPISKDSIDITLKYWSHIKPKIKVRGTIENKKFVIDHTWTNRFISSEYERYVKQDAHRKAKEL